MGDMTCAALIGDVVSSRSSVDRDELHARLRAAVEVVNDSLAPTTPLRIQLGDEFQGTFATVGAALHAALWIRLHVLPVADVRHGIGWGSVRVLQEEPRVEDGSAWWSARAAIEAVEGESEKAGTRALRTRYERAEGIDGPAPEAINAALMCRDQLLAAGDERTVRLLRGLLEGRSQIDLAADEGISPSAVSQRTRNDGIAVLVAAEALLKEVA